jgi:hypothetical protein
MNKDEMPMRELMARTLFEQDDKWEMGRTEDRYLAMADAVLALRTEAKPEQYNPMLPEMPTREQIAALRIDPIPYGREIRDEHFNRGIDAVLALRTEAKPEQYNPMLPDPDPARTAMENAKEVEPEPDEVEFLRDR